MSKSPFSPDAPPLAGGIEDIESILRRRSAVVAIEVPGIPKESDSHREAVSTIAELEALHVELKAIYDRSSRSMKDRVHPIVLQCEIAITDLKRVHGRA